MDSGGIRGYTRKVAAKAKAMSSPGRKRKRKYIGVRTRPGNKFGAEIILPQTGKRFWLGTYDTVEEAAAAYDFAARNMKSKSNPKKTNFPHLEDDGVSAAAAVLAHFAATKRKWADRQMEETTERKIKAAQGSVAAAHDAVFPGEEEEDAVVVLEMLKNQQRAASCKKAKKKKKKAAQPVVSSVSSPPSSSY